MTTGLPATAQLPSAPELPDLPSVPDLAAHPIAVVNDGELTTIRLYYQNSASTPSGPFQVRLTAISVTGENVFSNDFSVAGLTGKDRGEAAIEWPAAIYGSFELVLTLDPDAQVQEADEANNIATARLERERSLAAPPETYVIFERAGKLHPARAEEIHVQPGKSVRFTPVTNATLPTRVLVHRGWLEQEFGNVSSPFQFNVTTRPDGEYASFEALLLITGEMDAVVSDSGIDGVPQFTLGSRENIRLERPMIVRIVERPGAMNYTETFTTPNGTIAAEYLRYHSRLGISFESPDTSGQDVTFSKGWLSEYGIKVPSFVHEDGSPIEYEETSDAYVAHVDHFSTIYTFDTSSEGFAKVTDRTYSELSWSSANKNVNVVSDRRDPSDELFRRSLPSTFSDGTSFTVTSKWRASTQGNWQGASPIFLASSGVTDLNTHANSIWVYYSSRDANLGQAPIYYLRYRDSGGVLRLDTAYTGSTNTEYQFSIEYSAGSRLLTMKVKSASGSDLATGAYTIPAEQTFSVSRIGAASDGTGAGVEAAVGAWTDQIVITTPAAAPSSCEVAGPDAWGYTCALTAYAWQSLTSPTSLSLGDDAVSSGISLPFPFRWYGQTRSTIYIGSNGLVCFTTTGCGQQNPPQIPNTATPNDLVACFWEDLNPPTGGYVSYQTIGASPNRVFVVEYAVYHFGVAIKNFFQVHIAENGEARCMYRGVYTNSDSTPTGTGAENSAGSVGVRYSHSEFSAESIGVKFTPPTLSSSLSQNFDSGLGTWSADGMWHITTRKASSPTQSAWYGNGTTFTYNTPLTANNGRLTSPTFTVPAVAGTTNPAVTFKSWHQTESGFFRDVKAIEMSTDGMTWTEVGRIADKPEQWASRGYSLTSWAGSGAKLRFRFDTVDSGSNNFEGWYVDNVSIGSNAAPTASFTHSRSGLYVTVNGTGSSDPEAASLIYDWNWGDGSVHGGGPVASHTYSPCTSGTPYTITLTVTDGRGGSHAQSQTITVADLDNDGDTFVNCRESSYGTNPNDADSDNDGKSDGAEVTYWGSYWYTAYDRDPPGQVDDFSTANNSCLAAVDSNLCDQDSDNDGLLDGIEIDGAAGGYTSVFCPATGSCEWPNPRSVDIYIEEDWMEYGCAATSPGPCIHPLMDDYVTRIRDLFASRGIALHLFKDSAVPYAEPFEWDFDASRYYNAHFTSTRWGKFHYMLIANSGDGCPVGRGAKFGLGDTPGPMFVIFQGCIAKYPTVVTDHETFKTTLHELGHGLVGHINPTADQFVRPWDGQVDTVHDNDPRYLLYPNATFRQVPDYMENRWAFNMNNTGYGVRIPRATDWPVNYTMSLNEPFNGIHADIAPEAILEDLPIPPVG